MFVVAGLITGLAGVVPAAQTGVGDPSVILALIVGTRRNWPGSAGTRQSATSSSAISRIISLRK
jgi:hypothetical protein